jgi:hypothetical protein
MVWAAALKSVPRQSVRRIFRAVPVISNPAPTPQYRILTDWFGAKEYAARHSFCNSVIVIAHLVRAGVQPAFYQSDIGTRLAEGLSSCRHNRTFRRPSCMRTPGVEGRRILMPSSARRRTLTQFLSRLA